MQTAAAGSVDLQLADLCPCTIFCFTHADLIDKKTPRNPSSTFFFPSSAKETDRHKSTEKSKPRYEETTRNRGGKKIEISFVNICFRRGAEVAEHHLSIFAGGWGLGAGRGGGVGLGSRRWVGGGETEEEED